LQLHGSGDSAAPRQALILIPMSRLPAYSRILGRDQAN
jgi:hypothetical protein